MSELQDDQTRRWVALEYAVTLYMDYPGATYQMVMEAAKAFEGYLGEPTSLAQGLTHPTPQDQYDRMFNDGST